MSTHKEQILFLITLWQLETTAISHGFHNLKDLVKKEYQFFWKMCPDSKQDIRESWDLHSVLYKLLRGSVRIFFEKCAILRVTLNILPFLIFLTSFFPE